jgi:hypothetical protein
VNPITRRILIAVAKLVAMAAISCAIYVGLVASGW